MKKQFTFLVLTFLLSFSAFSQHYFSLGGKNEEICQDIRKDNDGNLYMVLAFSDVLDLDPSPTAQHLVTSKGDTDIAVAKFDRQGKFIWGFSIGSAKTDMPFSLRVDAGRNVYIGGYYSDVLDADPSSGVSNLAFAGGRDGFCAKYDSNGKLVGALRIGAAGDDTVSDLVVDANGNIYLGGKFSNTVDFDPSTNVRNLVSQGLGDVFFAKYNKELAYQWGMRFGNTLDDVPEGNNVALALDPSSNVYLYMLFAKRIILDPLDNNNKFFTFPPDSLNAYVGKYNANGGYIQSFFISSPRRMYISSGGISIDPSGRVAVTGGFEGSVNPNPNNLSNTMNTTGGRDIFVAHYTPTLVYDWGVKAGSSENDQGTKIATDKSGSVIVTGVYRGTAVFSGGSNLLTTSSLSPIGSSEIFVAKYSVSSNLQWVRGFGENLQSNQNTSSGGIAVDGFENVMFAANYFGTPQVERGDARTRLQNRGGSDITVSKLDREGLAFQDNTCRGTRNVIRLVGDTVLCEGSFTPIRINFAINDAFNIQWQESADGRNFTNFATVTTNTQIPITTLLEKRFYRAIFICTNRKDNDTTTVHFVKPSSLRVNAGQNRNLRIGDQVMLGGTPTAMGGQGRYRYEWSPRSLLNRFNTANPTFIVQNEGEYEFILTVSDTNCVVRKKVVITVESPLDAQTTQLEQSFRLFPNPARQQAVAEFYMAYHSPVRITLLDMKGREVQSILEKNMGIGQQKIDIQAENLPPQIYLLRISTDRQVITRKIVFMP